MALQSNPSEFKTGESDPKDFTVEAVEEVLKNADEDERKRIQESDNRETVKNWSEDDGSGDPDESEDTSSAPNLEEDGTVKAVDYDDLPDPKDENYDALQDPSVPSSVIAEVVQTELKVLDGKSPTLDECRKSYKENHSDDE